MMSSPVSNFAVIRLLLLKDLLAIFRSPQLLVSLGSTSLLLEILSSFAFRQAGWGPEEYLAISPGVLWIIFFFAGSIALNQSFVFEHENQALMGLLSGSKRQGLFFLSKVLVNISCLFGIQVGVLIIHGLLFPVPVFAHLPALLFLCLLGAIGLSTLGTVLSAIATATPGREILLPLLLFPLCLPLLAAEVLLMRYALLGRTWEWLTDPWMAVLIICDIIALLGAYLASELFFSI